METNPKMSARCHLSYLANARASQWQFRTLIPHERRDSEPMRGPGSNGGVAAEAAHCWENISAFMQATLALQLPLVSDSVF
jgi:hypothetical protein